MVKKVTKTESVKELTAPVYDLSGKEVGAVGLPENLFNVKANKRLVSQFVRVYLANQRQGTASTKTRSEVIGSTKKIYRQKGTGRARHGAKKGMSVAGGIIHAPKPRDYSLSMNSKQRQKAMIYALSEKFQNGDIIFVEGLNKIEPKTKKVVEFLKNLKIDNVKTLLVHNNDKVESLSLASRNIQKLSRTDAASLNAYVILVNKKIVFEKAGLEVLVKKVS